MRLPLRSRFVKDSGTLLSGSVVAQGIAFAAYVVLLRFFTPADFGLCNVLFSYLEVLIILSTCKYELSIVVAPSDREAAHIARLTLRLNTLVSLLLFFLALLGFVLLHSGMWTNNPLSRSGADTLQSQLLIFLLPLLVFFNGTIRVYSALCNRYKRYKSVASGEVATSVGTVLFRFLFGLLAPLMQFLHSFGLPLGTLLGKMVGHYCYRRAAAGYLQSAPPAKFFPLSHSDRSLLAQNRNFPLYVMPKEFVSSFSANLPFMWLGLYFDKPVIGLFSLAITFTMRPANILSTTFEKVFYAEAAQAVARRQRLGSDIGRFVVLLGSAAIVVSALLFFFAEPLFTFLFGSQWVGTGYYVRCILPWVAVLVVTNSLTFVANIFGTQRVDFILQLVQLVLRVVALWIGLSRSDFRLAVLLFCMASTAVQVVQLCWYLYQTHRYNRSLNPIP